MSGTQYRLLRDLTDEGDWAAATLEAAVAGIVRDRFEMAHALIGAAQALAKSNVPMVRRSAVSRAYYGAYQAARATYLSVSRQDEDDHDRLGKGIDSLKGLPGFVAEMLKELRRLRNEFDYSPYPGPNPRALYEEQEIEAIIKKSIKKSIREAKQLVRAFGRFLRERG
jgi:uncharacterized protein (UPF0332 family)